MFDGSQEDFLNENNWTEKYRDDYLYLIDPDSE